MPQPLDPTAHTHARVKAAVPEAVDVAIIGAGRMPANRDLSRQRLLDLFPKKND